VSEVSNVRFAHAATVESWLIAELRRGGRLLAKLVRRAERQKIPRVDLERAAIRLGVVDCGAGASRWWGLPVPEEETQSRTPKG